MAQADIEQRLRRIEACEDIRRLVATYAVGADRKNDPEVLGPLFSDHAEWILEDVAHFNGRAAIQAGLSELARSFVTWSMHYMISPLIEVAAEGTHATCRWYLWELATMRQADGSPADTWYGGWYDSELSVHAGAWLFDRVRLVPRIASPTGEAWTGKVPTV